MIGSNDDGGDQGGNPGRKYTVGYGKPPVEHQFKKGRSGNPNGRPIKIERTMTVHQLPRDIFHLLERERQVKTAHGVRKVAGIEMIWEQIFQKAIKDRHGPSLRFLIREHQKAIETINTRHKNILGFLDMVETREIDDMPKEKHKNLPPERWRYNQRYLNDFRRKLRRF